MKIIVILTFCFSILPAQDHLDVLIQNVLHGSRDSAVVYFPTMEQRYPNNPSLMYLKGLLENNGEEAMIIFSKLYNAHPASEYSDDAVMKVAEYYYAAGMYVKAANWLKKMPIYYSRSEHIERAVKLFLNSLIVSGHKDTAVFYSRVFERQFPLLDVDGKINDLLRDFEKSDQDKKSAKEYTPEFPTPKDTHIETKDEIQIIKNDANNASRIYSLQTGVYSVIENAKSQKINLIITGFSARIDELYKSNRTLYAVRIGHYDKREDAQKAGAKIEAELGINTIVITN